MTIDHPDLLAHAPLKHMAPGGRGLGVLVFPVGFASATASFGL